MAKHSVKSILFNAGGIGMLAIAGGYIIINAFTTERVQTCAMRYPAGQQFALDQNSGAPLSATALQGKLGWRQWGLIENAKVVGLANARGEKVLRVNLNEADVDGETISRNGVGFFWPVEGLRKANAACLSYRVHLPEDFKFQEAGRLPGLAGDVSGVDAIRSGDVATFAARVGWGRDAAIGVEVLSPNASRTWRIGSDNVRWTRGKWVTVEQEVILKTSGNGLGSVRLWVDGHLRIDEDDVMLRDDKSGGFSGVVADIGFIGTSKEPSRLFVSSPTVQWK